MGFEISLSDIEGVIQAAHAITDALVQKLVDGLISYEGTTTANGAADGSTIIDASLITEPDFDGNVVILTSGTYEGQARGINGATTGGTVTVAENFGGQVVLGTTFKIIGLRSVAADVTAVLTRLGDPTAHTLASLTVKWGNISRSLDLILGNRWDAAGDLGTDILTLLTQIAKLAGATPVSGTTTANWQAAEANLVSFGANDTKNKVHLLIVDITNLAGTITVRLYTQVNGVERRIYAQNFTLAADGPGLWIINGTLGIHEVLRCSLQSNNAADNGKAVAYDYMLEAM